MYYVPDSLINFDNGRPNVLFMPLYYNKIPLRRCKFGYVTKYEIMYNIQAEYVPVYYASVFICGQVLMLFMHTIN